MPSGTSLCCEQVKCHSRRGLASAVAGVRADRGTLELWSGGRSILWGDETMVLQACMANEGLRKFLRDACCRGRVPAAGAAVAGHCGAGVAAGCAVARCDGVSFTITCLLCAGQGLPEHGRANVGKPREA